ncbi:MAG TPA: NHL repeat-containing protein [Dehalococcoidia bacterium]|nr:NHL repeat-containing protein [Dehalococcoidia bacterium]
MKRVLLLASMLMAFTIGLVIGPILAQEISTVSEFDPGSGQLPEGLAADRQGNFYVGMAPTGEIVKVTPDGAVSPFSTLPSPGDGFMTGIAIDRTGSLFVALASFVEETHGIWRVSPDGSTTERFSALDVAGLPNVPALDRRGNLFVSDSFLGLVWKIDQDGTASVWKQDAMLEGDGSGPLGLMVGANGIAFDNNGKNLYVANTDLGMIVRIPVLKDGSAGEALPVLADPALKGADGIAFDVRGNLYVTVNSQDKIATVSPQGDLSILAEGEGLQFPASLAFGVGRESQNLYVTNFALLRASGIVEGPPEPALIRLVVGVPGRPMP